MQPLYLANSLTHPIRIKLNINFQYTGNGGPPGGGGGVCVSVPSFRPWFLNKQNGQIFRAFGADDGGYTPMSNFLRMSYL
jgi:hypothetical protein